MKTVELKMSRPETVKGFWPAPVVQKVLISGWGNFNFTRVSIEGVKKLCIDFSNNQKTQVCQVPYIWTV